MSMMHYEHEVYCNGSTPFFLSPEMNETMKKRRIIKSNSGSFCIAIFSTKRLNAKEKGTTQAKLKMYRQTVLCSNNTQTMSMWRKIKQTKCPLSTMPFLVKFPWKLTLFIFSK